MSIFVQQPHRRVRPLGNAHVYSELAVVERAALARGPRTRLGSMPGTMPVYSQLAVAQREALRQGPRMNGLGDTASAAESLQAWAASPMGMMWSVASTASAAACAYHGYKRNRGSVGWALAWGALGGLFFPITPVIAVAEGFGKPAKR